MVVCDQFVELALAEHRIGDVQPAVLPHYWLVGVQDIKKPADIPEMNHRIGKRVRHTLDYTLRALI